ncbi:hypothetical protein Q5P01_008400 [Channa striata]|uniref:Uncharacterized protein n=1 Tax=Channa striata TaxID=64152 RepID=A0AA88NA82_CHASR|nr:hypothetical protein Q5P01_008400 [Channa striata]
MRHEDDVPCGHSGPPSIAQNPRGLQASKEGIQATSGPAAASCCLPNAPRHLPHNHHRAPQGKRQGQPQQAAAYLTLPGQEDCRTAASTTLQAGKGETEQAAGTTTDRLLTPLGYPSLQQYPATQVLPGINLVPRYLPRGSTRPGQQNVAPTLYPQGKKDPRQAADITPGQLLAPLGYSNLA